jgi:hypothetical protein
MAAKIDLMYSNLPTWFSLFALKSTKFIQEFITNEIVSSIREKIIGWPRCMVLG